MSNRDAYSADSLVWETPPPSAMKRRYYSKWQDIADALRRKPGEWARLPMDGQKNPRAVAAVIKGGATKSWRPKGAFEATFSGDGVVHARYVGDPAEGER